MPCISNATMGNIVSSSAAPHPPPLPISHLNKQTKNHPPILRKCAVYNKRGRRKPKIAKMHTPIETLNPVRFTQAPSPGSGFTFRDTSNIGRLMNRPLTSISPLVLHKFNKSEHKTGTPLPCPQGRLSGSQAANTPAVRSHKLTRVPVGAVGACWMDFHLSPWLSFPALREQKNRVRVCVCERQKLRCICPSPGAGPVGTLRDQWPTWFATFDRPLGTGLKHI